MSIELTIQRHNKMWRRAAGERITHSPSYVPLYPVNAAVGLRLTTLHVVRPFKSFITKIQEACSGCARGCTSRYGNGLKPLRLPFQKPVSLLITRKFLSGRENKKCLKWPERNQHTDYVYSNTDDVHGSLI